jgi:hypothetical protein
MAPMRKIWRKWITVIVAIGFLIGGSGLAYHYASPKVELRNLSEVSYTEFVVQLPDSRVSIGPVGSGSFARVYFSPQSRDGTVSYSLSSAGNVIAAGEHPFRAEGQFFRKINVVIQPGGRVELEILD